MLAEHALYQLSYDPLFFGRQKYKKKCDFAPLKITVMTKILFVCHGNICRFYILLALQGIRTLEQGGHSFETGSAKPSDPI